MVSLTIALISSFYLVYLIVRYERVHARLSLDADLGGIQKVHAVAVPRVGGIAIATAYACAVGLEYWMDSINGRQYLLLLLCSGPAFISGLAEDLTKRITPRVRLVSSMAAAVAACIVLKAVITHVGIPFVDVLLLFTPVAVGLTVLSISGLIHAINIIDGLNGLASVVAIAILASIVIIARLVGDNLVMCASLAMIGAILGFLFWNYPVSRVFLGDGGAYFIGFMTAELLILLTMRNREVSPSYALLVSIYPVFETIFSIYRRRVLRGSPAGAPDGIHLHTLVFRRIAGRIGDRAATDVTINRNSRTSPYLWALHLCAVVPATLFWDSSVLLLISIVVFVTLYVWLYASIVKFKIPRWLRLVGI